MLVLPPVVSAAQQILLVVALTWMVLRFVEVTTLHAHRAIGRGDSPTLIDLIQRAARILVVTLSALLLFEAVGSSRPR